MQPPDPHPTWHREFRWRVPARFNIAEACCGRWARRMPEAVALRVEAEDGAREWVAYRFGELQAAANRLSRALRRLGVTRGDRVAIVLPQRFETAVAHIAIYQLGAVAMPLTQLFGPEALTYRLQDSGAVVAVADGASLPALRIALPECPALATVIVVDAPPQEGELAWSPLLAAEPERFVAESTASSDPAVLIYTSGTTGPPKGALIPHAALIGNLPGFVCSQNWLRTAPSAAARGAAAALGARAPSAASAGAEAHPLSAPLVPPPTPDRPAGSALPPPGPGGVPADAVFWSPADWAWTGGLMDALLPCLYFAVPIVACSGRFGPEKAFELMQRHRVTNTFLFPTALKAMMKAVPQPRQSYRLHLRAVMSAGEAVGDAVFDWCREALGVVVNEMFGQTEINYIVGNCSQTIGPDGRPAPGWPARPGSMGKPYPGHRVAVIDDEGRECPRGTPGDVALHRRDVHGMPDPIFFLGYWRNEAATRAKFTGDPSDSWCRTGDTAVMDEDGYLWYQGRSDDVFKAAGYRIGPSEIENCLVKHPAVANAAVVPKPDAERGALVKAYVVLAPGVAGSDELIAALQAHVRGRLAPYEYPKEIEFIDTLPMTTTGKVQRRLLRLREQERAAARAATG